MSSRSSKRRWRVRFERLLARDHLWSVLAVLVIVGVSSTTIGARSYDYALGDIIDADIVAPVDLRVPDPESTQRRRDEASAAVPDVYDFDPVAWREPVSSLNNLFAWGRERVQGSGAAWSRLSAARREALRGEAERIAGLPLPEEFVPALWSAGFAAEIELAAERLLRNQVQHSLLGTTVVSFGGSRSIRVRDITDGSERTLEDPSAVEDLEMAREKVMRAVNADVEAPEEAQIALGNLLGQLLLPNLNYNSSETQARKQAAADGEEPVFYQVKRGRTIGRAGDPVTEQVLLELSALREQWVATGSRTGPLGLLLLVGLSVYALWRYVQHHLHRWRFQRLERLHLLLLLVLVGSVLMTRVMLFIGEAVAGAFAGPPFNVAESYGFAIPFATGALLVVLLADAHVAWVYGAIQSVVVAAMTGEVTLAAFSLLGSFAAVHAMTRFRERTEMLRTGLTVAAVNAAVVSGFALLAQPVPPLQLAGFEIALAIFGGLQVALLASAFLPLLESLFNTLTDVKLLELSNMNLPLLRQLAVTAPGTYHHSVVIGTLAEKAAQAIDANPLFARVAAYYHDIGKMRQPEYFVENQQDGRNPHDKLSPHMSALILIRHVKDGVAYAREHRLPRPLVDIVPQHHGTRLMKYFYERARQQIDPDLSTVREEDFRYPGPKPQTKEAALIMLADGVEAMSRLIDDPTPQRMREMIRKNIRDVLEDGQLDQCNITLSDLARVEEAFFEVLSGMFHSRIEYPEERPARVEAIAGDAR